MQIPQDSTEEISIFQELYESYELRYEDDGAPHYTTNALRHAKALRDRFNEWIKLVEAENNPNHEIELERDECYFNPSSSRRRLSVQNLERRNDRKC